MAIQLSVKVRYVAVGWEGKGGEKFSGAHHGVYSYHGSTAAVSMAFSNTAVVTMEIQL